MTHLVAQVYAHVWVFLESKGVYCFPKTLGINPKNTRCTTQTPGIIVRNSSVFLGNKEGCLHLTS